jgi:hypothetical protein
MKGDFEITSSYAWIPLRRKISKAQNNESQVTQMKGMKNDDTTIDTKTDKSYGKHSPPANIEIKHMKKFHNDFSLVGNTTENWFFNALRFS